MAAEASLSQRPLQQRQLLRELLHAALGHLLTKYLVHHHDGRLSHQAMQKQVKQRQMKVQSQQLRQLQPLERALRAFLSQLQLPPLQQQPPQTKWMMMQRGALGGAAAPTSLQAALQLQATVATPAAASAPRVTASHAGLALPRARRPLQRWRRLTETRLEQQLQRAQRQQLLQSVGQRQAPAVGVQPPQRARSPSQLRDSVTVEPLELKQPALSRYCCHCRYC